MRMNNSKELSTYLVFAVVGMIFLIVGIFLTYNTLFSKTEKIQTTGIPVPPMRPKGYLRYLPPHRRRKSSPRH